MWLTLKRYLPEVDQYEHPDRCDVYLVLEKDEHILQPIMCEPLDTRCRYCFSEQGISDGDTGVLSIRGGPGETFSGTDYALDLPVVCCPGSLTDWGRLQRILRGDSRRYKAEECWECLSYPSFNLNEVCYRPWQLAIRDWNYSRSDEGEARRLELTK